MKSTYLRAKSDMGNFFIDPDIAKAKTIDTDFYVQQQFYEDAKEKIFAPSWQFVGDADKLRHAGDAVPFTLLENYLNEPLLLTKDNGNTIHCLSNVCTHRGNLIVYEACKLRQLKCRYHGRLFSLDGKFISMPEFKEVENFPTADDNLHRLPVFKWGELLFTSLHPLHDAEFFWEK
jgi:choline monooxygenase